MARGWLPRVEAVLTLPQRLAALPATRVVEARPGLLQLPRLVLFKLFLGALCSAMQLTQASRTLSKAASYFYPQSCSRDPSPPSPDLAHGDPSPPCSTHPFWPKFAPTFVRLEFRRHCSAPWPVSMGLGGARHQN